jgi:hypothetical protein
MNCVECDRLRGEYERLLLAYASAVNLLNGRSGTAIAFEYMRLRTDAGEARIDCEIARLELERHKRVDAKTN